MAVGLNVNEKGFADLPYLNFEDVSGNKHLVLPNGTKHACLLANCCIMLEG